MDGIKWRQDIYFGSKRYLVSLSSSSSWSIDISFKVMDFLSSPFLFRCFGLASVFSFSVFGNDESWSWLLFNSATLMASSRVFLRSIKSFPNNRRAIWIEKAQTIKTKHQIRVQVCSSNNINWKKLKNIVKNLNLHNIQVLSACFLLMLCHVWCRESQFHSLLY